MDHSLALQELEADGAVPDTKKQIASMVAAAGGSFNAMLKRNSDLFRDKAWMKKMAAESVDYQRALRRKTFEFRLKREHVKLISLFLLYEAQRQAATGSGRFGQEVAEKGAHPYTYIM